MNVLTKDKYVQRINNKINKKA